MWVETTLFVRIRCPCTVMMAGPLVVMVLRAPFAIVVYVGVCASDVEERR